MQMAGSALMVYLEPLNTVSFGGKRSICEMLHDPDEERNRASVRPPLYYSPLWAEDPSCPHLCRILRLFIAPLVLNGETPLSFLAG